MRHSQFLLTAAALCFIIPAFAQETNPGDTCTSGETNYVKQVGGPETNGVVHLLRCDGLNWAQYMSVLGNGNTGFGDVSPQSKVTIAGSKNSYPLSVLQSDSLSGADYFGIGFGASPAGFNSTIPRKVAIVFKRNTIATFRGMVELNPAGDAPNPIQPFLEKSLLYSKEIHP